MTRQLSASSVHAALRCGWPFRSGVRTTPQPSGVAAMLGTDVHLAIEMAIAGKSMSWVDSPFADVGPKHVEQAMQWLITQPPVTMSERGVVYNARNDTAEWGPRRGDIGYETTPPWCIRGTLDLGWPGRVVDIKTGKYKDYTMQLRTLGLAVARIEGRTNITVGALYTRATKAVYRDIEVMDEDALDVHAGLLHRLLRTLPMAEPRTGEQCRYCEVSPEDCPAFSEKESAA